MQILDVNVILLFIFLRYVLSIRSIFSSSDCAKELRVLVRQLLTLLPDFERCYICDASCILRVF